MPDEHRWAVRTVVVSASALALAVTGCGGSSGLGKPELVSRVDAICKRHNEVITAAASKALAGGNLPSPKVFGRLAGQTIVPEYSRQVDELAALEPGSEQASAYRRWMADSRGTRAKLRTNPAIIADGARFKTVNAQGDALGFSSDCHVGPSQ